MPQTITGCPGQTTQEVATRFGVSIRTVRRWNTEGSLTGVKVGREIRYADEDIERFALARWTEKLYPASTS